jgi:hypothetical protein
MSGFSNDVLGGASTLIRKAIHSLGFLTGVTGWSINKDGSAEFNNIIIRGGTVVSGTALYYNGAPAVGTLFASISAIAGTDIYGNNYPAGIALFSTTAGNAMMLLPVGATGGSATLAFHSDQGYSALDPALFLFNSSNADSLFMQSSITNGDTVKSYVSLILQGSVPASGNGTATGFFFFNTTPVATLVRKVTGQWDENGFHIYAGTVNATQPGTQGSTLNPESWHAVTPATGWSLGGSPEEALSYRMLAETNTIWICGATGYAGTPGAGTLIFTLPAAYAPTHICIGMAYNSSSSIAVGIQVAPGGAVLLQQAVALNPNLWFNFMVPLGL